MEITRNFREKVNKQITKAIKESLGEVAIDITTKVRNYIEKQLYRKSNPLYYDRTEGFGGYLDTFASARNFSKVLKQMTRVEGNRVYITFVLRDFDDFVHKKSRMSRFNHHMGFDGRYSRGSWNRNAGVYNADNRRKSEMDDWIDRGWHIPGVKGLYGNIRWRDYAEKLVSKEANDMLKQKLKERGYDFSGQAKVGPKRLSIPVDTIKIVVED